jgi:anthranilate synthase component 1
MSYFPSEKEFIQLTKKGNLIPVYKEILGDLETPVSAYLKISKHTNHSFLLESVEGEEKVAHFSFLAKDPDLILESKNNSVTVTEIKKGIKNVTRTEVKDNPLSFVREIMKPYKFVNIKGLPRFCGGMLGYISYDVVKFFEKLPNKTHDDLKLPDMILARTKDSIIFDHLNHKIKVLSCVYVDPQSTVAQKRRAYRKAVHKIDQIITELRQPLTRRITRKKPKGHLKVKSNFTEQEFKDIVNKAKKYIRAGEIIQVVLSQRLNVNLKTNPFNIYRCLRSLNPSPYMYYLNFQDTQIIGSSPELLVRCENNVVETRPIAGTRPRGKTEKQDAALARELLADPKEKAEHVMLVDLGRNDLGRVCQKGTVHLSEFMSIEKYSHVMHIVSNVVGQLDQKKYDRFDVLKSAFPAGTLSGAPKIRAMEIIEELEKETRGPYGGCIGYFSFSGNLDTCITIRTIVSTKGKAYVQAGAGIVADSKPKKEYQETLNKANAQITAIKLAHQQMEE